MIDLSTHDLSKIPDLEEFPKEYADVFTNNGKPDWRKCPPSKMALAWPYDAKSNPDITDQYGRLDMYVRESSAFYKALDDRTFTDVATYIWFRSKFIFNGKSFGDDGVTDGKFKTAYGEFQRGFVGVESDLYFGPVIRMIQSYVPSVWGTKEFYTDSDARATPPKSPFPNVRLAHWDAVMDVDERMSLLKKADADRMPYAVFLDYVTNWIQCYNAKYGKRYAMVTYRPGTATIASVADLSGKKARSNEWLGKIQPNDKNKRNGRRKRTEGAGTLLGKADDGPVEDAERVGAEAPSQGDIRGGDGS